MTRLVISCCLLATICCVTGCGPAKDPYAVPEQDDVKVLLQFIEKIEEMQPETQQEINTHRVKAFPAIRDACDKILSIADDKSSVPFRKAIAYRVTSVGADNADRQRETVQYVSALLTETKPLTGDELKIAQTLAQSLEQSTQRGSQQLAADAYLEYSKTFRGLTPLAGLFEGSHRRLTLVGKAFEFEAKDLDGNVVSMEQLKGQVVLFDFWATWCGPCLEEVPNVRRNLQKYQKRGFAVVGVSIDENIALLESFVKTNEIPWPTVAAYKGPKDHPSVEHYGVMTIPQMIVVGRDGKVIATDVRGHRLNEILAKEFRAN